MKILPEEMVTTFKTQGVKHREKVTFGHMINAGSASYVPSPKCESGGYATADGTNSNITIAYCCACVCVCVPSKCVCMCVCILCQCRLTGQYCHHFCFNKKKMMTILSRR